MARITAENSIALEIERLQSLRSQLLSLHHALLEMERRNFEKMFGRLTSGELLQLVINHAQFAWLRVISALVVQIDELLDREEPVTLADIQDVTTQARALFTSSGNEEFRAKYELALQQHSEVVMAHSALMKLVRSKASSG